MNVPRLTFGVFDFHLTGELLLVSRDDSAALVQIAFLNARSVDTVLNRLSARLPQWQLVQKPVALEEARDALHSYLTGAVPTVLYPHDLLLSTSYQASIQARLLDIPAGETRHYGDLAGPSHGQAAGQACATNALPLVVPCHRVLPASGGIGNYIGGAAVKRDLLAMEQAL